MATKTQETKQNGQLATNNGTDNTPASRIETSEEKSIIATVTGRVNEYITRRTLHLPEDYSVDNALKSAWLYLCQAVDKDKRPLLQACTRVSVTNALLDYVIQGLNTSKKQAYFIAYGNVCTLQRSYFGDQLVAARVKPGITFYAQLIRRGDEVRTSIMAGRRIVIKHESDFDAEASEIIGAYCGYLTADGEDMGCELMTISEIKKSWEMSPTYKWNVQNNKQGTHQKFEGDMALRTVIRKRCKSIYNTSGDSELMKSILRTDLDRSDALIDEEIAAQANGEYVDVEPVDVVDAPALPESGQQVTEQPGEEPTAPADDEDPGY